MHESWHHHKNQKSIRNLMEKIRQYNYNKPKDKIQA